MNVIDTANAWLEHNFDGLDFMTRTKNAFHARDASTVFKTQFDAQEIALRQKYKLSTNIVEGKCMRALFYDFHASIITNPMDANSIRTMDVGSAVENIERSYYQALGIYHSAHIRMFNKEYNISGEIDTFVREYDDILNPDGSLTGQIKFRDPKRLIGIEIKSFYGYYAEKEILTNGVPKWNHLLQALLYLDYFKPNIPYWLLVYLSRSSGVDIAGRGRIFGRQFRLQISRITGEVFIDGILIKEFMMSDVYSRFKQAKFLIESEQLPDRDYVYNYPAELVEYKCKKGDIGKKEYSDWKNGYKYISDWQCSYCPYLYACWKDVYGEKVRGADKQKEVEQKPTDAKGNTACTPEEPKQQTEQEGTNAG